jgi:hypothetical protein
MVKVNLVFRTLWELWDFKQVIKDHVTKTVFSKRVLVGELTEAEIELAIHAYHARAEKP